MAIKTYRPITPTLRFQTSLVNDDLTTDKPHKPLLTVRKRTGGRRNSGARKPLPRMRTSPPGNAAD